MVYKNRCVLVLWTKIALALEGLITSEYLWTRLRCHISVFYQKNSFQTQHWKRQQGSHCYERLQDQNQDDLRKSEEINIHMSELIN